LGAAFATMLAGYLRNSLGSYNLSSMLMGAACIVAAIMVLRIKGHRVGGDLIAVVPA